MAAPLISGTAVLHVPRPGISISPARADVVLGGEAQFEASLDGTVEPPTWAAEAGTVDSTGLYRAPARAQWSRDVVTVSSSALWLSATAVVRLLLPAPILSGTSGSGMPGGRLTVLGTGLDVGFPGVTTTEVVFQDVSGNELSVTAETVAADRLTVRVPAGAVAGPLHVRLVTPGDPPAVSNAVTFDRGTWLRVHAARAELAAGESTPVDVAFLGGDGTSSPLTFQASTGSVTGGVYTTPAVTAPTLAQIDVCIEGASTCSSVTVVVRPFVVAPSPAVVPAGGSLAFSAHAGGSLVAASFSLGSGGGAITADGAFTAASAVADAGASWILADVGGVVAPVQVAVTGLAPGLVARAEADAGAALGRATGASARLVEIGGGRAYVAATPNVTAPEVGWLDAYDLTDPLKPVWLGATEMTIPTALTLAHGRVYALSVSAVTNDRMAYRIEVFDVSGTTPALVATSAASSSTSWFWAPPTVDAERLHVFGEPDTSAGTLPLAIHRLADGPLAEPRTVVLPPAPDAMIPDPGTYLRRAATARDGRAWRTYLTTSWELVLGAWDITSDPPVFLGSVGLPYKPSGVEAVGPLLVTAGCFDRRPAVPVRIACTGVPVAADGDLVIAWDGRDLWLSDYADPTAIITRARVTGGPTGRLAGTRFYAAEGSGGLAMYDLGPEGGPRPSGNVEMGRTIQSIASSAIAGGFLYGTGGVWSGYVAAWDLGATSPALTEFAVIDAGGTGVAVAGAVLVVATTSGVQTWSLADPAHPVPTGSLALDATAVATEGSLAYVGTTAGDVVVVDVSTPATPVELGRVAARAGFPVRAVALLATGRVAVAIGGSAADPMSGDLGVLDLSVPSAPVVMARTPLGAPATDVAVGGGHAFVTTSESLVVAEVADPAAPRVAAVIPLLGLLDRSLSRRVALSGEMVWVVDGYALGFDVRTPAWPRLVSESYLGSHTFVVNGARAYTLPFDFASALLELDLSLPRNVVLTPGPAPAPVPGATLPY